MLHLDIPTERSYVLVFFFFFFFFVVKSEDKSSLLCKIVNAILVQFFPLQICEQAFPVAFNKRKCFSTKLQNNSFATHIFQLCQNKKKSIFFVKRVHIKESQTLCSQHDQSMTPSFPSVPPPC